MRVAYLGGKGMSIELLQQIGGDSETGFKHLCLLCEGIDEVFKKVQEAKVHLLHQAVQELGDSRFFFALFPAGEWIEFLERKRV